MKQLVPFTPTNCDQPVAYVSPDLDESVKNVINEHWADVSSGLGCHYSVEELASIEEQELIDELNEEYANANAW